MELTDLALILATEMLGTFSVKVNSTMNGHIFAIALRSQKKGYIFEFKPAITAVTEIFSFRFRVARISTLLVTKPVSGSRPTNVRWS
jgi:hypothetical protein